MKIFWWPWWKHDLDVRCTKLAIWFVWLLPRWVVLWCSVRLMAHATTGKWSHQVVPDLTALDALKRWERQ
jgi:hypothetical protein